MISEPRLQVLPFLLPVGGESLANRLQSLYLLFYVHPPFPPSPPPPPHSPPVTDDSTSLPPCPLLLLYSDRGTLCPFTMINTNCPPDRIRELVKPPGPLPQSSPRRSAAQTQPSGSSQVPLAPPSQPAQQRTQPPPTATPILPPNPTGMGTGLFGSNLGFAATGMGPGGIGMGTLGAGRGLGVPNSGGSGSSLSGGRLVQPQAQQPLGLQFSVSSLMDGTASVPPRGAPPPSSSVSSQRAPPPSSVPPGGAPPPSSSVPPQGAPPPSSSSAFPFAGVGMRLGSGQSQSFAALSKQTPDSQGLFGISPAQAHPPAQARPPPPPYSAGSSSLAGKVGVAPSQVGMAPSQAPQRLPQTLGTAGSQAPGSQATMFSQTLGTAGPKQQPLQTPSTGSPQSGQTLGTGSPLSGQTLGTGSPLSGQTLSTGPLSGQTLGTGPLSGQTLGTGSSPFFSPPVSSGTGLSFSTGMGMRPGTGLGNVPVGMGVGTGSGPGIGSVGVRPPQPSGGTGLGIRPPQPLGGIQQQPSTLRPGLVSHTQSIIQTQPPSSVPMPSSQPPVISTRLSALLGQPMPRGPPLLSSTPLQQQIPVSGQPRPLAAISVSGAQTAPSAHAIGMTPLVPAQRMGPRPGVPPQGMGMRPGLLTSDVPGLSLQQRSAGRSGEGREGRRGGRGWRRGSCL